MFPRQDARGCCVLMAGDTAAPSVASRGAVAKADPGSVAPPCRPRNQMAVQTSPRSDVPVCGVKEEEKKRGPSETRDWRGSMGRAPSLVGIVPSPGGQVRLGVTPGGGGPRRFSPRKQLGPEQQVPTFSAEAALDVAGSVTTRSALELSRAGGGPSGHSSDSGRKRALNAGGSRNHSSENLPPRVS